MTPMWCQSVAILALFIAAPGLPAQGTCPGPSPARPILIDDFDSVSEWKAVPSDGVSLAISRDPNGWRGSAMRLDVDFHGGGGYAVAHRALDLGLPANYELSFRVRGEIPAENLEVKLIDSTGNNVWWLDRRDYAFPVKWTLYTIKKRQISFAWGPRGGGELKHAAALELSVTAGSGGKGSVWIDELTLTPRDTVPTHPPAPVAHATSGSGMAARAIDGREVTEWRTGTSSASLTLDLRAPREYGGLAIDWDSLDYARDYDVETSSDGQSWNTAYRVRNGDGGRDYIQLPESESRAIRLALRRSSRGHGYAIREVQIEPLSFGASRNALYFAAAKTAPRGDYPRAFTDSVQTYWTVIGAPAAEREGLVGEDGRIEVGRGMFSIEPFVHVGHSLVTWANVRPWQSFVPASIQVNGREWPAKGLVSIEDDIPIPAVTTGQTGSTAPILRPLTLTTTAWVAGTSDSAVLYARYNVRNYTAAEQHATFFVAIRPLQVNGPFQFLNTEGGATKIDSMTYDGHIVTVHGAGEDTVQAVIPVTRPDAFGATTFDAGGIVRAIRHDSLPATRGASDSAGRVSGALGYDLTIPPNGGRDVVVAVPFGGYAPPAALGAEQALAFADSSLARTEREWAERERNVVLALPDSAKWIARTLRVMQAYILTNQDGPAIQPGSRSYERSWIRDGALTSEALLRTGHADRVRAFLDWYAPYQYANGKVPCCVDRRGADPVAEHDSNGEFLYLVRQYFRYAHDTTELTRMWPRVVSAVSYLDSLRRSERTSAYTTGTNRLYYGLLPASISHEGYSAKPMHSYWDDFWALRGFKDAAAIAQTLGKSDTARVYGAIVDEFRTDLMASISASMAAHRIDYIPGAADLGDFDPTSTTIALEPGGEQRALPQDALAHTFDRYWEESRRRAMDAKEWDAYTPYELRTVGAFVRLDEPERAQAMLDFFHQGQRPEPWHEWAEVVRHGTRVPGFIGDMPHTWVGSDFIRSALDLFAYSDEGREMLVIGAGIPESWRDVRATGMRTPYGTIDVTVSELPGTAYVHVGGSAHAPAGGVEIHAPFPRRPRAAFVDGATTRLQQDGSVLVHALPVTIGFSY